MRIVFVLHQFYPEFSGGTERVVFNLARSVQRAGHYVHVLACTMRARARTAQGVAIHEVYRGIPVTLVPREHLPAEGDIGFDVAPLVVDELRDWMRAQRFDLMHVFHTMRMASAVLAAQQCGLPYVTTLTDFFTGCYRINAIKASGDACADAEQGHACARDCLVPPWTDSSLEQRHQHARAFLQAAGERVVPSEYVARYFRRTFPDLDWRVVPHGVDFLGLLPIAQAASTTPVAAPPDGVGIVTLGYLGAIIPQKGLRVLLQALARVDAPHLQLRIVGDFSGDPVHQAEIERLIAADPRVQWVGPVAPADVAAELERFDMLCLPSTVPETFSLALHEAATLRIPALVSDLGAPPERIHAQGGGKVVAAGDVVAWAQALGELAADPTQLRTWRSQIRMPYRMEEEAFFYESLYRQLVAPK